jgi:type I restriction enzyme, S subunit
MKDSGVEWLEEVPAHWRVARLGYFASVENGMTPSRDVPEYWVDGEIAWLSSGEVNKLYIESSDECITKHALEQCSLRVLPVGKVVVGLIGQGKTRGMSALLRMEAAINQNLAAVCPGSLASGSYLLYLFHAIYDWVREAGRGGNQAAMNCEMLRALRLLFPSVSEQQAIAKYVDSRLAELDALKSTAEEGVTVLRERRTALISAAVTGQIDVRQPSPTQSTPAAHLQPHDGQYGP